MFVKENYKQGNYCSVPYVIASMSDDRQGPFITGSNVGTANFLYLFLPVSFLDSFYDGNQPMESQWGIAEK